MRYSLKLHPQRVTEYLRNLAGVSRQFRNRLFSNLDFDLRLNGDSFRESPDRRVSAGSSFFWYRLVLRDDEGDGKLRRFSFLVNDAAAVYGVLEVEFVHFEGPM